jgi:hypothetical protein
MDFLWKKQISPPDDSNPPEAYHGLAACLNEPSHSLLYHRHIWAACSPQSNHQSRSHVQVIIRLIVRVFKEELLKQTHLPCKTKAFRIQLSY